MVIMARQIKTEKYSHTKSTRSTKSTLMNINRPSTILLTIFISVFFFTKSLYCAEAKVLECEVIEVSPSYSSSIPELSGINYLLIHHAKESDREILSKWLKNRSGSQITFYFKDKKLTGILFRLSNCFGRGLLIYKDSRKAKKHDLIKLILPETKQTRKTEETREEENR